MNNTDLAQKKAEVIRQLRSGERPLSFSSLKRFMQSPGDLVSYLAGEYVQTDAMRVSKMIHCIVLEGVKAFELNYYTMPENIDIPSSSQAKKVCEDILQGVEPKQAYEVHYSTKGKSGDAISLAADNIMCRYDKYIDAIQNANGRETVAHHEYNLALEVNEALQKNAFVRELLCDSEKELQFDDLVIEGIRFRGFVDVARRNSDGVYLEGSDLKVYAYVHPLAFQRKIFADGLHIQAAIYCMALGIPFEDKRWHIVAVDKDAGNIHHQVYQICADALAMGWEKTVEAVKYFKHCRLLDAWEESYPFFVEEDHGIFPVHCPWWYV